MVINFKEKSYGDPSPPVRKLHLAGPPGSMALLSHLEALNLYEREPDLKDLSFLINFGAVYVNNRRCNNPQTPVGPSDIVRVHVDPRRYPVSKTDLEKRIIFENDHFAVVNKPAGLPMHPTLDNLHENLIASFGGRLLLTHRLDVPTSGLVVLAKTKEYQSKFNILVMNRGVQKKYLALTEKSMEPRRLHHFIKNDDKAPKQISSQQEGSEWQDSILDIESCTPVQEFFELSISLITGRTHQIRAQLAFEGNPLIGDVMYGGKSHFFFGLHATELSFECPVSKTPMTFNCLKNWWQ